MATGSLSVNITLPVTNARNPNYVGRNVGEQMLAQAMQALGDGKSTSGNLTWPPGADAPTIGTWVYVAPTT